MPLLLIDPTCLTKENCETNTDLEKQRKILLEFFSQHFKQDSANNLLQRARDVKSNRTYQVKSTDSAGKEETVQFALTHNILRRPVKKPVHEKPAAENYRYEVIDKSKMLGNGACGDVWPILGRLDPDCNYNPKLRAVKTQKLNLNNESTLDFLLRSKKENKAGQDLSNGYKDIAFNLINQEPGKRVIYVGDIASVVSSGRKVKSYEVQPFYEGEDLSVLIGNDAFKGPEKINLLLRLTKELAEAVKHIHTSDYIHRDIKPENTKVKLPSKKDSQLSVQILDFGFTLPIQDCREGDIRGTPVFLAPEIWRAEKASPASDVYAMGITLMEAWGFKNAANTMYHLATLSQAESFTKILSGYLNNLVSQEKFPSLSTEHLEQIKGCFQAMLAFKPQDRLSAKTLASQFSTILKARIEESKKNIEKARKKLTNFITENPDKQQLVNFFTNLLNQEFDLLTNAQQDKLVRFFDIILKLANYQSNPPKKFVFLNYLYACENQLKGEALNKSCPEHFAILDQCLQNLNSEKAPENTPEVGENQTALPQNSSEKPPSDRVLNLPNNTKLSIWRKMANTIKANRKKIIFALIGVLLIGGFVAASIAFGGAPLVALAGATHTVWLSAALKGLAVAMNFIANLASTPWIADGLITAAVTVGAAIPVVIGLVGEKLQGKKISTTNQASLTKTSGKTPDQKQTISRVKNALGIPSSVTNSVTNSVTKFPEESTILIKDSDQRKTIDSVTNGDIGENDQVRNNSKTYSNISI